MIFLRVFWLISLATVVTACSPRTTPTPEPAPGASPASPSVEVESSAGPPSSPSESIESGLKSPDLAARHLYEAWQSGDRDKAERGTSARAIDAIFERPPFELSFLGCDAEGENFVCTFAVDDEPALRLTVIGSSEDGFIVDQATFL